MVECLIFSVQALDFDFPSNKVITNLDYLYVKTYSWLEIDNYTDIYLFGSIAVQCTC